MAVKSKYAIVIFDNDRIDDINNVVVKYSDYLMKSSSHFFITIDPINLSDVIEDLSFFKLSAENERDLDAKLKAMIEELDSLGTEYTLRDEDTQELVVTIKTMGALDIKFDDIHIVEKGTYKKIDSLKNSKFEFGYTKGYKPSFRPMESKLIEDIAMQKEVIYLFANSSENLDKLRKLLSEKAMEIDSRFKLDFRRFA